MEVQLVISIILCTAVFLLFLIMVPLLIINNRIANLLNQHLRLLRNSETKTPYEQSSKQTSAQIDSEIDVSSGSYFEEFLKEDRTRRSLPKKEQFKAYRIWRKEKGLNWQKND